MQDGTNTPTFTDPQWADLYKWLPRSNHVSDDDLRQTVTAMLYAVRTGTPWEYIAIGQGNPNAISRTWNRWAKEGMSRCAYHCLFPASRRNLTVVVIYSLHMPAALEAHGARQIGVDHECHPTPNRCIGKTPLYCPRHQARGRQVNRSTNLAGMADADGEPGDWCPLSSNFQDAWATPALLARLISAPEAVVADGRHNIKVLHAAIGELGAERRIPSKGGGQGLGAMPVAQHH